MGAILEMTMLRPFALLALAAALLLPGCGNDPAAADFQRPFTAIMAKLKAGRAGPLPTLATLDAAGTAVLRQALEADKQPIYLVASPSIKYLNLMAPYGLNGDVQTWASPSYESISLRQDLLVATRGFGADLMSSTGPSVGVVRAGQGRTSRSYYYLDGADQPQSFRYACVLAQAGSEQVTVLGKSFATRKITESCSGDGDGFVNEYWFDLSGILRQSRQRIAPGMGNLTLQKVID